MNLDAAISKDHFHKLLMQPGAVKGLRSAGVDPVGLVDFADYIFSGEFSNEHGTGVLTLEQLIETILELGGLNPATLKDIVDARKVIVDKLELVDLALEKQNHVLQDQVRHIESLVAEQGLSLPRTMPGSLPPPRTSTVSYLTV